MSHTRTIKLEGLLDGYPILLLVDSDESHNFIAKELVASLGLDATPTKTYGDKLGNSNRCVSQGLSPALEVNVGRKDIVVDIFMLDL